MIGRFIEGQRYTPPVDLDDYLKDIVTAFDSCVDFLRDPERFPNKNINDITTLMWQLIGNKEIPVALDKWGFKDVTFAVVKEGIQHIPFLIVPLDFTIKVQQNPIFQLGVISYMASQCRDYYARKINGSNSEEVNKRAQAFESEALLTVKEMLDRENVTYEFEPMQAEYMRTFPNGIESLPIHLNYPTPKYRMPPIGNNN